MSETTPAPARMTMQVEASELSLRTLAGLLTNWQALLAAAERGVSGTRRAVLVWRVVELTWEEGSWS